MESTASFKSHHLPARRAKSATTHEPELWVQRCELRVTVSQRTGDDNILCSVFCAPAQAVLLHDTVCTVPFSRFNGLINARASYQGIALAMPIPQLKRPFRGCARQPLRAPCSSGNALQCGRKGIERERTQEVAAQAALDFAETFHGALHPGEVSDLRHSLQFAQNVRIPYQLRRPRLQEHQVFEQ